LESRPSNHLMAHRKLTTLLIAGLFVLVGSPLAGAQAPAAPEMNVIVTQGSATVKRTPDRAWVSIAAEGRAGKAADARTQAATQMTTVQASIKAAGIPADAIKTTSFSLQPQMVWDGKQSRPGDYVARNEIDVRVDNLDVLSAVLDAAGSVRTTGNLFVSITGVRFDLKNPNAVEQEALTLAVQDAVSRARTMASAGGRSVGPVLRMEEQRQWTPERPIPMMMRAQAAAADMAVSTPIEPNEVEVRSTVTITVRLQ
jgi:uncharacterized protein YggE